MKKNFTLIVLFFFLASQPVSAASKRKIRTAMLDTLDMLDRSDFKKYMTLADGCLQENDTACVQQNLKKARYFVVDKSDYEALDKTEASIAGALVLAQADACITKKDFLCVRDHLDKARTFIGNSTYSQMYQDMEDKYHDNIYVTLVENKLREAKKREELKRKKVHEILIAGTILGGVALSTLFVQGTMKLSSDNVPSGTKIDLSLVEVKCKETGPMNASKHECRVECKKSPYASYTINVYNSNEYCGTVGLGWSCKESLKELLDFVVETGNYHCN